LVKLRCAPVSRAPARKEISPDGHEARADDERDRQHAETGAEPMNADLHTAARPEVALSVRGLTEIFPDLA
jgi:hypothetical protein